MQATEMAEMPMPFLNKQGWDQKKITGFVKALNSSANLKNQEVKFASTQDTFYNFSNFVSREASKCKCQES